MRFNIVRSDAAVNETTEKTMMLTVKEAGLPERIIASIKSALTLCLVLCSCAASAQDSTLALLNSGEANVVLMRHALAPGTGDPYNFELGQCETQRNLNDVGRQQAVDTGAFFRDNAVAFDRVYTSEWCRCVETAELLELGTVEALPAVNSFFQQMQKADEQTTALKEWLAARGSGAPVLLVTHQVNITAYTGVYPRSGELVVGKFDGEGEFTLLGRVDPR